MDHHDDDIRSELCEECPPVEPPESFDSTPYGGIAVDPLQVYKLTLDAILQAQKQLLYHETADSEFVSMQSTCRIPATCPPGFQGRYTVRSGDTMFFIARRFGVTLQALINANPHIPNPNVIFPCDVLCVPGVDTCRVPTTCPPGFQGRYTVRSGDTMFLIAQRFGVTLQALINANPHIPNPNVIFPCDVLCVPGVDTCRVPATCPPGFQGRYTVRSGDTMFLIAQRFGVTLQALIDANPHITNPDVIFPCDVLCVPS
jgi:LysM repeat protein